MKSTTQFKKNKRGIICLNCEQPISDNDNFCSNCGQVNDELPLSIKQFVSEFFSGFFSFDTRFFNTFIPLLFKPGKVSKDYIEGKRRRYVNPFQLYLHVTIVFFLMQGLFSALDEFKISGSLLKNDTKTTATDSILRIENENLRQLEKDLAKEGIKVNLPVITTNDSINNIVIDSTSQNDKKETGIFSISNEGSMINTSFIKKFNTFVAYNFHNKDIPVKQALDSLKYKKTKWNMFYYKKATEINKISNDAEFRKSFIDDIISKISIALFFMLPIFTWFISLLYIRHKKNYTEHLVLVFNVQTVFFILLIFFTLFDRIFKTDIGIGTFIIIFLFYLYKSLRNFYKQNRVKTIIKYFMLNTIFVILSSIGGVIIMFLAFAL